LRKMLDNTDTLYKYVVSVIISKVKA